MFCLFQILNSITEDLLDHTGSYKGPIDQVEFIKTELENSGGSLLAFLLEN